MRNGRFVTGLLALAIGVGARSAAAQGTIKTPGDHTIYVFEAEPHFSVGYAGGFGPGFRGTLAVLDRGFIPSINDSVGVGVGAEWLFYSSNCSGPPTARVCDSVGDVMVPIVIQWNFWLTREFSVFGEPGIALHFRHEGNDHRVELDPFTIFGGMRFQFSRAAALTLRLEAPELFHHDSVLSIGVSFLI